MLALSPALDTARAYRIAIAEYIRAMATRDGVFPDTLYIGRHEEFPDIELPSTIEGASIEIIDPAETGAVKDSERFIYLNVFGWLTGDQAEFVVVNFGKNMAHRPDERDDADLYLSHREASKEYALDSLRFRSVPNTPTAR